MNMNPKLNAQLREFNVNCIHAFFTACCVEGNGVAFADFVNQATNVDENFLFGGGVNDKTKAFGGIEKFYCSGIHCKKRKKVMWQCAGTKVRAFVQKIGCQLILKKITFQSRR